MHYGKNTKILLFDFDIFLFILFLIEQKRIIKYLYAICFSQGCLSILSDNGYDRPINIDII